MKKLLKKSICILLSAIMLVCLAPSTFAQTADVDWPDNYMPGTVLVGVKKDAPKLQDLIPEFEVKRTEYADMDPDYAPYKNSHASDVMYIKLVLAEQTKEIVWKVIDALKDSEYVVVAEPFYCVYMKYAPGRVLVSLNYDVPSFETMLEGFNITNTRLITPGSATQCVYVVEFEEKTKEIVWEAIQALSDERDVKYAEPDYIGSFAVMPPEYTEPTQPVVEPTESTQTTKYAPGRVLVSVTYGASSFGSMLKDFNITNIRLLTPGSPSQIVYLVEFEEQTNEIVLEAIDVLSKEEHVICAEPDYIGDWAVEPIDRITKVLGDADGDGELTILDATLIQRHLAKLKGSEAIDLYAANISGSGELTIVDATLVQRTLAGYASW